MQSRKRKAGWDRYDWAVEPAGNNVMGIFPNNTVRGTACEFLRPGFFLWYQKAAG